MGGNAFAALRETVVDVSSRVDEHHRNWMDTRNYDVMHRQLLDFFLITFSTMHIIEELGSLTHNGLNAYVLSIVA